MWLTDPTYLSDIFDRLHTFNLSLQGPNSNLTMSDKIVGFVRKLERWRGQVVVDMFPTLDEFIQKMSLTGMSQKKEALSAQVNNYFPEQHTVVGTSTTGFVTPSSKASNKHDALMDLSSDRTLKTLFWLSVETCN